MPAFLRKLPERVMLQLAANRADRIQYGGELGDRVGGVRLTNRTAGKIYYLFNGDPTATVNDGFVPPGLSLPLDVVEPAISLGLLAELAGEVEAEITEERFSAFGAVGITSLLTLNETLAGLAADTAALAAEIQQSNEAAEISQEKGTGALSIPMGTGAVEAFLIYEILHNYDRRDTGQAGRVEITIPSGYSDSPFHFYWGSADTDVLGVQFRFPPIRIVTGGDTITIGARTPNNGSVIHTLTVVYRTILAP